MEMETTEIRCKKCGKSIWTTDKWPLMKAHCQSDSQVYSNGEIMPEWAMAAVNEANFMSGSLYCQCQANIGAFNFVSGRKCPCGEEILPPVHLNLKKLDIKSLNTSVLGILRPDLQNQDTEQCARNKSTDLPNMT